MCLSMLFIEVIYIFVWLDDLQPSVSHQTRVTRPCAGAAPVRDAVFEERLQKHATSRIYFAFFNWSVLSFVDITFSHDFVCVFGAV